MTKAPKTSFRSGSYGVHIQDEAAYQKAVNARIRANSRKGRERRWLAEDTSRGELVTWLFRQTSAFCLKMQDSYSEWGTLTAGQETALRKMRDDGARLAARRAEDATSTFVHTVGQRIVMTLTLKSVSAFESIYGTTFVHRFSDDAGNILIYKGSKHLDGIGRGERVTLKATIKAHDEYQGIKRTLLARPVIEPPALV